GKKKGDLARKKTPTTPQDRKSLSIKPKTPGSKTRHLRSASGAVIDWKKERSRSSARRPSFNTPNQSRSRTSPSSAATKSVGTTTMMERKMSTSTATGTPTGKSGLGVGRGMESGSVTPTRKGRDEIGQSGKKSSTRGSSEARHVRVADKKCLEESPSAARARRGAILGPSDVGVEGNSPRAIDRIKKEESPSAGCSNRTARKSSTSILIPASRTGTVAPPLKPSPIPHRNSYDQSRSRTTQRVETSPTQNPKPGSYKALTNWTPPYRGVNAFRAADNEAAEEKKNDGKENETQAQDNPIMEPNNLTEKYAISNDKERGEKKITTFLKRKIESVRSPIKDKFGIGVHPKSPRLPVLKRGKFDKGLEAGEGKEREGENEEGERKKREEQKKQAEKKEREDRNRREEKKEREDRKKGGKAKEQGQNKEQGESKDGKGVKEESGKKRL
ncbi:MAG: hypothetical protein Q9183_006015, partial [Haloplaca sp. 2 TL-2023]